MSSVAALASVRRTLVTEDVPALKSGSVLSNDQIDIVSRAANFRIEADFLRDRALASSEAVIREQYLALADRWSMLAAGLETELMSRFPK